MSAEPSFEKKPAGPRNSLQSNRILPKLRVGSRNDPLEKQADQMADHVMKMPDSQIQMQGMEEEEELQMKMDTGRQSIRMQPVEEEEEEIQMTPNSPAEGSSPVAGQEAASKMEAARGKGQSLPKKLNHEMSQKMGADFSNVSIHSDKHSNQLSQQIGARAFTLGNDIFFNSGEFNPDSKEGKHLLAHELTHVMQNGNDGAGAGKMSPGNTLLMYPDLDSPTFWETLRHDAVDYANDLVSNNDRAINQLARDLSGQENASPEGAILIDLVDFSMDIAKASPASKLGFKLLQRIYSEATQVRSGTMEFSSFSRTMADATQQLQNSIPNDWSEVSDQSPEVFREIKQLMENETSDNMDSVRSQAINILREANSSIPGYRDIMKKLVQAWIGAAVDQTIRESFIDLGDPEGFSAGYLRIHANIRVNTRLEYMSHSFTAINIDDIDLPTGTKNALITAWGENYYLDELPFPGVIHLRMGEHIVILTKTSSEETDDLAGWEAETVNVNDRFRESTINQHKQIYFEHIRPRIEHLTADD